MKKSILLTVILSILAFALCNKMDYDFCFSQVGGPLERQMDIDAETLQIRSESEYSKAPWNNREGQYYAELEGFTVPGTKNNKEVSFNFRQRK